MTAHRTDDGDGGTDDGEPSDEVREILDSIDGAADEVDAAADDSDDDEFDTDPRSERFGYYAGGLVTVLLGLMLFVGPWRLVDVTFSGGIPFEIRDSTGSNILVIAPVVIALVGTAVGAVYRATTEDKPDDYRWGIAMNVVVVQLLAAFALFVLLMLVPVGSAFLDGQVTSALGLIVVGVVYLLFFTFFEVIGISLYVGIPAIVGVYVGDLVGSVVE